MAGSYLAGHWFNERSVLNTAASSGRKILYYQDPMNPAYKSDKPGVSPACGMPLEPVYSDDPSAKGEPSSLPPNAVNISPEKQQIMGLRVGIAEKAPASHTFRFSGRVAPDETRLYRISAGAEGFIRAISQVTTGDHVKKDQVLAEFSVPNSLNLIQLYILNLGGVDRINQKAAEGSVEAQAAPAGASNISLRMDQLRNLGMSYLQMEEIRRTRALPEGIRILSPAEGFVLARNVSVDQKFQRGDELFRIADLRRVWILADVFGRDAKMLRPGMKARVTLPGEGLVFQATLNDVLPQFDPDTRTLKLRMETDNPEYALRPNMLVDAELPVTLPSAVSVPVDAVVDSGLNKTIFIDRGNGFFEPRQVETGWRFGDKVEIVRGLAPGERIVVSGTFLVDSESRMKAIAAGIHAASSKDPTCGMEVDEAEAKDAGLVSSYQGKSYYFCSAKCKNDFDATHH